MPAAQASQLAVYADTADFTRLLGPKGWTCVAIYAADGSGGVALYAPGETVPADDPAARTGPLEPPSADEAVTVTETGGSQVQAAATACPYFASAAAATRRDLQKGCAPPPRGETVEHLSSTVTLFGDPPGVAGGGVPSGGPYPANGVVTYTPVSPLSAPGSHVATCTLPPAEHAVCTTVLDDIVSRYGH